MKNRSFAQSLLDTVQQQISSLKVPSLLVATGVTFSLSIPASAIDTLRNEGKTAAQPPAPKQQLISQNPQTVELTLVSFAVTKEAYSKVIPLFQEKWKRERNQEVKFVQSYGGSGSQTRAVIDGLEADVVHLALGFDVDRIQKAGLIDPGWEREAPNDAVVTRSVVALVTRPGNPKNVKGWSDLTKPGISVVTANPKTSGVARWNFLALWGAVSKTGGDDAKAQDYVTQVFKNVPVLAKDARELSDIFFKKNQGDVLINYENEVVLAAQKGETGFFTVIPQNNISIDNSIAVVDKVVNKRKTREVAEAFVQFLYTPEAQREFAKVGFRPVNTSITKEFDKKFPKVNKLYTIKDFGGWSEAQKRFFDDGAIFDRIQSSR
jgi:sulfate/thiosulfate-binding protein